MATFDWLGDIFGDDTFQTIVNGVNNAGSIFNSMSPLINRGAQLALGINGTQNAAQFREANQNTLNSLNDMFSPTGDYAKELRNQLERKDAAAGRRSQYGTRETELMTNLAKQKAAVLTSPAYQNYLARANMSQYAPIAGAIGNITNQPGQPGQGQQGQQGRSGNTIPSGFSSIGQYISNLFGPGAEASIANLGGAASALAGANNPASMGVVDTLGSMFGGSPFLPGYAGDATGIFGNALGNAGATAGAGTGGFTGGSTGGTDLTGAIGGLGDWLGGAGSFGGAGGALSGMGGGSLAGTVGGADTLGSMFGGTGFLPGYTSTGASSLFGGAGSAGAAGAEGAAGAGAAGAGAAGATPWLAAGATALPFLLAAGGMLNGIFGGADNGNPYTQANDAWTNAIAKDPSLLKQYGQGDVSKYMQGMFGGDQWTPEQYNKATNMLSAASGGGSFFGNALGNAEQGMGG